MAIINFPDSPAVNDTFSANGVLYKWDGTKWQTMGNILEVSAGGTSRDTLTANSLLAGNGTSAVNLIAPSTSGNVLTSNGTAWTSLAPAPGVPSGALMMWSTASPPTGYLLCDGAAVSRTTYATLFALINTTFGAGNGTTTFNLPNYVNRMPIGVGSIAALAATGGSKDAVVVSHTHTATVTDPGHSHSFGGGGYGLQNGGGDVSAGGDKGAVGLNANTTGISISNSTTGVSGTNANLPPYLGINFIIKT